MQTETPNTPTAPSRPSRQRVWLIAAVAAAVIGIAGIVVTTGDDGASPLVLDLGASDALASCLPVDAEILSTMPLAFAGTATDVDGQHVTLRVDEWYVGGDAETVQLHAAVGMEALIAGFDFVEGTEYLVSATEGTVNFCGYSGPSTPELQAVYREAFPT